MMSRGEGWSFPSSNRALGEYHRATWQKSCVFFCTKPRQAGWYMKECEMVNMWKWRLLDLCSSFSWMLRHCDVCWSWLLNPNCSLEFKSLRAYRKIMKAGDEVTNNKTWVLYRCCAASTCINHQLFFWRTLDSRMCNVGDSECFR